MILKILRERGESDLAKVYEACLSSDPKIHRESVYRDLERLVKVGLLTKTYDHQKRSSCMDYGGEL